MLLIDFAVNVNVHIYSPDIPVGSADCTIYTPVLEHTLLQSHLLWGEFSICALCCSYSQSLQFSFLVPPGTHHCWVDRGGMIWEACPTPLHMTGSVTRASGHPSKYYPGSTLLNFSDLKRTGYHSAMCYQCSTRNSLKVGKKNHGNGFNNNIDREYLSVNNNEQIFMKISV